MARLPRLFGYQVSVRRKALRLTQRDLASRASLSQSYVGLIERGLRIPSLSTAAKIASALDTHIPDLLYPFDARWDPGVIVLTVSPHEFPRLPSRLTPHFLATTLTPYLLAIADVQSVIEDIRAMPRAGITIRAITQVTPIHVHLDGAGQVVGILLDHLVPWRKKHAMTMARLKEQEALADLERKELENRGLSLDLQLEQLRLATEMLAHIQPHLSEAEAALYVHRLMAALDTLTLSPLELGPADQ